MKNIHVIPTDKPSRLYKRNDLKNYYLGDFNICNPNDNLRTNQNIYITSDEEIKEGDWCHTVGTSLFNSQIGRVTKKVIEDNGKYGIVFKKIILTTDEDLIKDGIQAIDDEFLEWFVSKANDSGVPIDIVDVISIMPKGYKIIIPKEEQKQNLIDMMQDDEKLGLYDETLEEAKFIAYKEHWNVKSNFLNGFEAGAKWQAERSYSEEEVQVKLYECLGHFAHKHNIIINGNEIDKWFEQFKKK